MSLFRKKKDRWFVSWFTTTENAMHIANGIIVVEYGLSGEELIRKLIEDVQKMAPGATILGITKI